MTIFIVEDDEWYGRLLSYNIGQNPDHEVEVFKSGHEVLAQLHRKPGLITLDYSLPDMDGEKLLRTIKEKSPETPVILVSGQEDVNTAVKLLNQGAFDYFVKDDNTTDRLWSAIHKIGETQTLKGEIAQLKQEVTKKANAQAGLMIGESEAMKQVLEMLERATRTNINVMIHGETGTGKEVAAKYIHLNSNKVGKPFVAVNVAAIPRELIESELFGHEKGAFTGALQRRIGRFEEAKGGTLFLDEIGELDKPLQAKLLRVLQERELVRVGGSESVKLDFRLISATHRNLEKEVKDNNFREDLYYRLVGLPITLPPLRDRGQDIAILATHFVADFAKENGMGTPKISKQAFEKLLVHQWPGNVRELKAVMDLAVVMSDGKVVMAENIGTRSILGHQVVTNTPTDAPVTLDQHIALIVKKALDEHQGNVVNAAQQLGVGKSTIYRMLKGGKL